VLEATPGIDRLCASYHDSTAKLLRRSRLHRIGIFILVMSLSVAGVVLARRSPALDSVLPALTGGAAVAAAIALRMLAILSKRDMLRLRRRQAERLLRAVRVGSRLAPAEVEALTRCAPRDEDLFFCCYALWRAQRAADRGGDVAELGLTARTATSTGSPQDPIRPKSPRASSATSALHTRKPGTRSGSSTPRPEPWARAPLTS
jgi:hypothetical protein